jgi:hypothetical protein
LTLIRYGARSKRSARQSRLRWLANGHRGHQIASLSVLARPSQIKAPANLRKRLEGKISARLYEMRSEPVLICRMDTVKPH